MKFFINDFFCKCDQIRRKLGDLVTFTEEILNGTLHFLHSVRSANQGTGFYILGTLVLKEISKTTFLKREAVVWTNLGIF